MSAGSAWDAFDFIKLVMYDIHCIPRGQIVTRRAMEDIMSRGKGMFGGLCFLGLTDELIMHDDLGKNCNFANKTMKPILQTLKPCEKSACGKHRVGQILCNFLLSDGTLDPTVPRTAAEIQLEKLQSKFGLTLRSAFEMEFIIIHRDSEELFSNAGKFSNMAVLDEYHEVMLDMMEELNEAEIRVDALYKESGPGQIEVSLGIDDGIKTPDSTANFKTAAKSFLKSRGYDGSFMTVMKSKTQVSNGYHFNHSLWSTDETGNRIAVFLNATQPNSLSEIGCHWLAGLIEHAPAMVAMCCPTVNCYRRIGTYRRPSFCDWGVDNRLTTFRLKVESRTNVYIENRLPSSACNPYLTLACTVAAGMDGIQRKLPLPEPGSQLKRLPDDLDSALLALETDSVMVDALGEKLVKYFVHSKRQAEVEEFKVFTDSMDEQKMKKEMEVYFLHI